MKFLIFMFCAFLEFSISIPIENAWAEDDLVMEFDKDFPRYAPTLDMKPNQNGSQKVIKYYDIKPSEDNKKEYLFIRDLNGNVVMIIDASSFNTVISYRLPDISGSMSAIVGDTLYNIFPRYGKILSTTIENLIENSSNIQFSHVGSFPSNSFWVENGIAVDGSLIYFVTIDEDGDVYVYDTISRLTTKLFTFEHMNGYASMIVVQKTLYFLIFESFYSFDGTYLITSKTPDRRHSSGLFQMGNNICMIGGNYTDVYPDPVHCYNPITKAWHISSYINEARWYPGVAGTKSKTYIVGGDDFRLYPNVSNNPLYSIEVLDHETNIWSYAPSPLTEEMKSNLQALLFHY